MILVGDCRERLRELPERSVQTCVTSPPYFGLRDYSTGSWEGGDEACDHLGAARGSTSSTLKTDGRPNPGQNDYERDVRTPFAGVCGKCGATRVDRQIGLEPTPDEFVAALVAVFREVRRVLRDDGCAWINLGDSYAGSWGAQSRGGPPSESSTLRGNGHVGGGPKAKSLSAVQIAAHPKGQTNTGSIPQGSPYKPKDLIGIPWMVAFALRADGWYLRSEIIWAKRNCMPESVTDRPTKAHEQIFLLSKQPTYFYDAGAIREGWADDRDGDPGFVTLHARHADRQDGGVTSKPQVSGRNKRSVWHVATQPFAQAHFATFPPKLIEPCILAGSAPGDVVLDPFAGAGTVGVVCGWHGREFVGVELNPEYAAMAEARIALEGRPGGKPENHEHPNVHDDQLGFEVAS